MIARRCQRQCVEDADGQLRSALVATGLDKTEDGQLATGLDKTEDGEIVFPCKSRWLSEEKAS